MRDKILLRQLQALPLNAKVLMTQQRIREWYNYWHGDVVISFSGGKDSTVLAHLVHDLYPDVPMVFSNTGLEYPEIQEFARRMGAEFVRPKMRFDEVISKYGYPIIGKEVAEAIQYARRIVSVGGGTTQTNRDSRKTDERKRTELEGRRCNELLPPPTQLKGSAEINLRRTDILGRRQNYEPGTSSMPQQNCTAGQVGKEQTLQAIRRFQTAYRRNGLTVTNRNQTNPESESSTHGKDGDESQSPG